MRVQQLAYRCPSETKLAPNPKELTECLDLAEYMLFIDGIERITPTEILKHPFILENDNAGLVPIKKAPIISPKGVGLRGDHGDMSPPIFGED
ncbi:unnamed protein product [Knipowitschia caucasica]